jgi:hypothetical protein
MPFQYTPYRNQYVGSITDLMGRGRDAEAQALIDSANAQAQAAQISGQAWGGAIQGIGNTIAAIPGQIQAQQDRELALENREWDREQQLATQDYTAARTRDLASQDQRRIGDDARVAEQDLRLKSLLKNPDGYDPKDIVALLGPERGGSVLRALDSLQVDPPEPLSLEDRSTHLKGILQGLASLSPEMRIEAWPATRARALANTALELKPEDVPEVLDEAWFTQMLNFAVEPEEVTSPGDPFEGAWAFPDGTVRPAWLQTQPDGTVTRVVGGARPKLDRLGTSQGGVSGEPGVDSALEEYDRVAQQIFEFRNPDILDNFPTAVRYEITRRLMDLGADRNFFTTSSSTPSIRGAISKLDNTVELMIGVDLSMTQKEGLPGKIESGVDWLRNIARADHERELFVALSLSLLPSLARMAGEVGNLAEKEQKLYKRLAPGQFDTRSVRMAKYAAITYLVESAKADMQNNALTDTSFNSYLSKVLAGDASGISAAQAALISESEDTSQMLNKVDLSNVVPTSMEGAPSTPDASVLDDALGNALRRAR